MKHELRIDRLIRDWFEVQLAFICYFQCYSSELLVVLMSLLSIWMYKQLYFYVRTTHCNLYTQYGTFELLIINYKRTILLLH